MPDYLVKEVSEYIDYLLLKHAKEDTSDSLYLSASQELVKADFSDYLSNE
jgi:hypothetical protein